VNREGAEGPRLILAFMHDLRPIRLEIEVRAVIQVVTLHAHLHDFAFVENLAFLVPFVFDDF
jgi:hypothetical protein